MRIITQKIRGLGKHFRHMCKWRAHLFNTRDTPSDLTSARSIALPACLASPARLAHPLCLAGLLRLPHLPLLLSPRLLCLIHQADSRQAQTNNIHFKFEEHVISRVSAQHLSRTTMTCPTSLATQTLTSRRLFRGNKNILVLEIAGFSRPAVCILRHDAA